MLCTFTTKEGSLCIRSEDIRALEDLKEGNTLLVWDICGKQTDHVIIGSAVENRDRVELEELDLIARVEAHRYRTQMLLQAQPTPRGRQAGS